MKIKSLIVALAMLGVSTLSTIDASAVSVKYGDVNQDGVISLSDVVALNSYLQGTSDLSKAAFTAADVNRNHVVNAVDAQRLLRRATGITTAFPAGTTTTLEDIVSMSAGTHYTKYDYSTGIECSYYLYRSGVSTYSLDPYYDDHDNRIPDSNTAVVELSVGGSGFIIGDHLIATAAHCVYNNGFIEDLTVRLYNADCNRYTEISPLEVHVPAERTGDGENDYALIYVEEDLSSYGKFTLGMVSKKFITDESTVYASGFPGETIFDGEANCTRRYVAEGQTASYSDDKVIMHHACISGGDSGGPLYMTEADVSGNIQRFAIGITSYIGNDAEGLNFFAIRLTSKHLLFYYNNDYINGFPD